MMSPTHTLMLAEAGAHGLTAASRAALGGAQPLQPLTVLVVGPDEEAVLRAAAEAAALEGVQRVLRLEPAPPAGAAEALAHALVQGVRTLGATHLVAASTLLGRSVLPYAAGLLEVAPLSEVIGVIDASTFERPIHAGSGIARLRSEEPVQVLTLRASAFSAPARRGANEAAPIEPVAWVGPVPAAASHLPASEPTGEAQVPLVGARAVVSGGRGVGSPEGYERLRPLARALGAALGASRAAVDSGFADASRQVGQTGQSVAPELYVALGISGAIQHWAGMKDSRLIVAVNTDAEAPIFQFADIGLVADLFTALPTLEQGLPASAGLGREAS